MVQSVLIEALIEAGIEFIEMPEGVRRSCRNGAEIWLNFNEHAVSLANGIELAPVSYRITDGA